MLDRLAYTWKLARVARAAYRQKPSGRQSVADRLEQAARRFASRPFLRFEGRTWTYADWNEAANRVAHWGFSEGLGKGDVVALLMENRPEYLALWAGLAKLGATTALVNPNLRGDALRHAFETSGAETVVVGHELLGALASMGEAPRSWSVFAAGEEGARALELPAGVEDLDALLEAFPTHDPSSSLRRELRSGDDLFYIYTSGTTGNPKAARFSHMRFLSVGDAYGTIAGYGPEDAIYCALPLYHTAGGVIVIGAALATGACVVLRRRFSASRFWEDVRAEEATAFHYIGEFCRYLLNQPEDPRDRDHRIRVAVGNGLRPDIWERFQQRFGIPRIREFYGATEGNVALVNLDGKPGSVGRLPFKFLLPTRLVRYDVEGDVHVRDAEGLCVECRPGEVGELVGRIPERDDVATGRFEGYTSPEETRKKLLRDVFAKGDVWFRTGDLLRCDREGYFYFVDRIGDTFRWKGENVATQEVEELLSGYPGVEMVVVYGVAVPGADGRAGMATLVGPQASRLDGKALYAYADPRLPRYAMPAFVRVAEQVDVTGTFKLRKLDLQRQGFDPRACGSDALLLRDDEAQAYRPLDPDRLAALRRGDHRL